MYKEYNKVKTFLYEANKLLDTKMEMSNIFEAIYDKNAKKVASIYTNEKGKLAKIKYKQVKNQTLEIAKIIDSKFKGVNKNVPIVLKVNNCVRWPMYFWAILMNGFKPLLLNAKTAKDGADNIIVKSKAAGIISDDNNKYDVIKLTPDDFKNNIPGEFTPTWENEMILCSSGTTGEVKLMVFNGENMCHQICESLELMEESKDIMYPDSMGKIKNLAMLPFHHIFGFVAVYLWYSFYGKIIVYPSSMIPNELFALCRKVGVTHLYSVPLLWDSLATGFERKVDLMEDKKQNYIRNLIAYNTNKLSKENAGPVGIVEKNVQKQLLGTKIRFCISGGGYLNTHSSEVINGVGYPLYNGFGMTEVGVTSVELSPSVNDRLLGSIGRPFHGVEYKIDNPQANGNGELLIKSKAVHVREIISGVEQGASIDENGYFNSGDIAYIGEDGRAYIKGRIKDIIINADGENVFPDELELYFKGLPHVSQLSVLGVNKKDSTNQKIVIVLEVENTIKEDELKDLNDKVKEISLTLPKGTQIEEVYFAKGKLPISNSMKVKRFEIRKAIEANNGEYIIYGAKTQNKKARHYSKEIEETIKAPLKDLFSKVLVLPNFKIDDEAHWINDLGGDSMNYVELVQYINEKFSITVPEEDYGKMTNVNDFVEEIAKLKSIPLK